MAADQISPRHALRVLRTWQYWTADRAIDESIRRGMDYLATVQQSDGSWQPRWFGNASFPGCENPIYGTSQVVLAYRDLDQVENRLAKRALDWLVSAVDPGGGWGGGTGETPGQSSVEETAMAVEALLGLAEQSTMAAGLGKRPAMAGPRGGRIALLPAGGDRTTSAATFGIPRRSIRWRSRYPHSGRR